VVKSWSGPAVAGLIVLGVVAILALNFQPSTERSTSSKLSQITKEIPAETLPAGPGAREYPIGEPVVRNSVQVAAVWLAGVSMEGMPSSDDLIHLEADVRATENNPNGFAKDEFVPYLKVAYTITDAATGASVDSGTMLPMIASDGLHYGASVAKPKAGQYKLLYKIDPPSSGGLGRHVGLGGVAPWWTPFDATFDWTVEPPSPPTLAGKTQ
jgi:uncharacterized protein involved in high-affinity Fe2+ transport